MFFTFQKDAHWTDRAGRGVRGRDRGVSRRVFRRLLPVRPTPELCVEAYPQPSRFGVIAELRTKRSSAPDRGQAGGGLTPTDRAAPWCLSGRRCRSPR